MLKKSLGVKTVSKMRVLWIFDFNPFDENRDGQTKIYAQLLDRLQSRVDGHLITTDAFGSQVPARFSALKSVTMRPLKPLSIKQKFLNLVKVGHPCVRSVGQLADFASQISWSDYDVVHISHIKLIHLSRFHPNSILGLHDSLALSVHGKGWRAMIKRLAFQRLERHISRLSASLFLVSELDALQYKKASHFVIPNGVDTGVYRPKKHQGPLVPGFVFHGNMDYGPNQAAVEMMSRWLKKAGVAYPLHVVGRSSVKTKVRLSGRFGIKWIGEVDSIPDEITRYQFYFIAMASPSGIKNKLLEALSCGCVVIANQAALNGIELDQRLKEAIYLVHQAQDLSQVLSASPSEWDQKKVLARQLAEQFSWDRFADRMLDHYQRMGTDVQAG